MSLLHANKKKIEVASYLETFFIFVIFAFVLIILYPKDMLREQILSESSNYDLTATYLENMLKLEPDNVELLIPMAKVSLQTGKYDLAEKILEALKVIPDDMVQKEVHSLDFNLLSIKKNSTEDNQTKREYNEQLSTLVNKIASEKLFKKEDAANWFNEAISLSQKEAALTFIQPLYRVDSDLYWLEQCLYLSTELKNETEKKYCVNKLATMDTTRSEKWLKTAYQVSVASNNLAESLVLISQLATIDPKYLEEYARLELMVGNYIISSELYMQCFYNTKSHRKKGKFLLKALRSLQNGNLLNEVVVLAKKHENQFVRNTKVSSEIMKIYLAAGKLDSAKNYAAKVLKAKEK